MALTEDAASILDEFVHDVSNLPAEIQHLLEEVQAKDEIIEQSRREVLKIDQTLQKFVKTKGGHEKHDREGQMVKTAKQHYDKMQALQEDKVALSQKACVLLDRHVKRLDLKIRTLQSEGSLGNLLDDVSLPSTLHPSPANLVEPISTRGSGISTPLNGLHYHMSGPGLGGGAPNIANAAMARMANTAAQANRGMPAAPMAGMAGHPLISAATGSQRAGREGSADPSKKRKLHLGPLPSSNLARGASTGPGTPKAGTPTSRAGSLGPRTKKPTSKKAGAPEHPLRKKITKTGISKKQRTRLKATNRASPSTTGEEVSDASGSEEDDISQSQADGADEDEEMADGAYEEEESDQTPYCFCRQASHGDMIACDNKKCQFEWFHYACVGLVREPKGKWLCPTCQQLPPNQIKMR